MPRFAVLSDGLLGVQVVEHHSLVDLPAVVALVVVEVTSVTLLVAGGHALRLVGGDVLGLVAIQRDERLLREKRWSALGVEDVGAVPALNAGQEIEKTVEKH